MLDEKINQKYLKKIKLFQKYNKHYYDLNKSLVNDSEFDKLKQDNVKQILNPAKTISSTNFKKYPKKTKSLKAFM